MARALYSKEFKFRLVREAEEVGGAAKVASPSYHNKSLIEGVLW